MLKQSPPPHSESRLFIFDVLKRRILQFAVFMIGLNLLLPSGLYIYSKYLDEPFWKMFRGEIHPVDWFSSVQMLLIAGIAYLNYKLATRSQMFYKADIANHRWIWLLLAFGFAVFSLDERFDYHEALRDNLFRPSDLFTEIPWLLPGDVGLYIVYVIGIAFTPFILAQLRGLRGSTILFVAALALTLPAIVIDSMADEAMQHWRYQRFWDYTFEEVGEIWAQLLFLLSFLTVLYQRLDEWVLATRKTGNNMPEK